MSKRRGKLQFLFLILFIFPLTAQTSSVTSDGYIRDWQNDGDHVAYSTSNGNVTSVMTADEERLVLRKYDERHRLTSETVWGTDYEKIMSETVWTYSEKGIYPESMQKKLPEQKQRVEVLYTETGLEKERSTWNTGDGGKEDELVEKTVWQYDDKKRVTSKSREYRTEKDGASSGGKKTETHSEKMEYTYTDKAKDPDSACYEDDVLIQKIVRISDSSYTESLYFDDMEIKSTWSDGVKTEEVYYLGGKEIKRKTP